MEKRWQTEVPGRAAVTVLSIDGANDSIYVADGWGVAFAALRLRRLSLADGRELATARLGNQVRCVTRYDGELLAATDTKIFRLDPSSLEEIAPRWDRRVPRFTDVLCRIGDRLALANWKNDACAVADLDEWRVRRVRPGPYPVLIADQEVYVFSRGVGRLSRLDADDKHVRLDLVADGPPGIDVAYDERERVFWILEGEPVVEVRTALSTQLRPGPPSDRLRRIPESGGELHVRLDRPARRIALDPDGRRLWAVDADSPTVSVYSLSDVDLVDRHELPATGKILTVAPSVGIVMTETGTSGVPTTTLTCFVTHAA